MTQLSLTTQYTLAQTGLPTRHDFRRWVKSALQADLAAAEITLRLVDTEEGQTLNRDYRGKDYATNVLTFTFDDEMPALPGLPLLGDIVLCVPVVAREAAEQGKPLADHYAHLVIHGVLHLQGYDHLDTVEAEAMESLETALLARFGIANPYAEDHCAPDAH